MYRKPNGWEKGEKRLCGQRGDEKNILEPSLCLAHSGLLIIDCIMCLQRSKFSEGEWKCLSNLFSVLIKTGPLVCNSLICNGSGLAQGQVLFGLPSILRIGTFHIKTWISGFS